METISCCAFFIRSRCQGPVLASQACCREPSQSLPAAPWSLPPWFQLCSGLYHSLGKVRKSSIPFPFLGSHFLESTSSISFALMATLSLCITAILWVQLIFSGKFELLRSVTPQTVLDSIHIIVAQYVLSGQDYFPYLVSLG